ncbi:MAG: biotin transporter BioY [Pseudanabaenaceae cyanobacterium SKYGB_i_bin29]|nr:biotin transporter BioY [Pseudanabaenaceae cyanobacterium SKYG29]MDW8422002.1 biotin transporter BioY [Pseudanabaenaceae cyanobacterium SKYGB_i_bin29]
MVVLTQMQGAIYLPVWEQGLKLKLFTLNARLQLGGVFLTAYLGGETAAFLSQVLYLGLGLLGWNQLSIFGNGGGPDYWQEPTFGYLVGFVPAAYLAGIVAFSRPKSLANFLWSGILGLLVIHLMGMGYLLLRFASQLSEYCLKYTLVPLPSQLAIVCTCTVIAYLMRLLLLY